VFYHSIGMASAEKVEIFVLVLGVFFPPFVCLFMFSTMTQIILRGGLEMKCHSTGGG